MQNKNKFHHEESSVLKLKPNYFLQDITESEKIFNELLCLDDLDKKIKEDPIIISNMEASIEESIANIYQKNTESESSHLFLQRVLYRINRMKLFWYDNLENYRNECSRYLASLKDRIEFAWLKCEENQLKPNKWESEDIKNELKKRYEEDLEPEVGELDYYFRNKMTKEGYCCLLSIASLDGFVEASQLSRMIGGLGNEIQCVLTRLLFDEYGGGRLSRKHSTYFRDMLIELGMNSDPEYYFQSVPWEVLANINLSFYLCDRNLYFLRYIGGLLFTETSVPFAFKNYIICAKRLKLSKKSYSYWDIHVKADKIHGKWMLEDVAIPLAVKYDTSAWEILWGYDQQKFISRRAVSAVFRKIASLN